MNVDEMRAIVKEKLPAGRFEHTVRVAETAVQLAKQYGESIEKAEVAGLLHDYAKCDSKDQLKRQMEQYDLPMILLDYHKELWHGPVGAMIAKEKFDISDDDAINAIYYHTTGREKMSKLELILFVADYIEPGRKYPGVEEVRDVARVDLEKAAQIVLKNTIIHLANRGATIFPDTILAYNELTKKIDLR